MYPFYLFPGLLDVILGTFWKFFIVELNVGKLNSSHYV